MRNEYLPKDTGESWHPAKSLRHWSSLLGLTGYTQVHGCISQLVRARWTHSIRNATSWPSAWVTREEYVAWNSKCNVGREPLSSLCGIKKDLVENDPMCHHVLFEWPRKPLVGSLVSLFCFYTEWEAEQKEGPEGSLTFKWDLLFCVCVCVCVLCTKRWKIRSCIYQVLHIFTIAFFQLGKPCIFITEN